MTAPLRAKKKTSNMIVWGILGLLAISFTGFGVRSVGHGGTQAVASVGSEKVTVDAYTRALRSELAALSQRVGRSITLEQARTFGLDRQVLSRVLLSAALDGENRRLGISAGDERVREKLLSTQAFQSVPGKFDQTTYVQALKNANLKPAQYDTMLRNDAARTVLQTAVVGGVKPNQTYANVLLKYVGETRDFEWAEITPAMLAGPTRAPTEAEIKATYEAAPATYTSKEIRKLTYVSLTPEMVMPTITAEDSALRDLYASQSAKYHIPAQRVVDRLVFPDRATADAALASVTSGSKIFDDIIVNRGLTPQDVSMGKIAASDLPAAASKAVFALTEPGLVGPVDSSLGPAIFRVNAIIAKKDTSFADAKAELRTEIVADQARRKIDDAITSIDDLMAGGATLEDVAAETDMQLATLDYETRSRDGLAADDAFRALVNTLKPGDFPEVKLFKDGGIFAARLDKIIPPALIPLADVRARVIADWQTAETRNRVVALANTQKDALIAGGTFADLGLTANPESNVQRAGPITGAPTTLADTMFTLADNGVGVDAGPDHVVVARLTVIQPFDAATPDNAKVVASLGKQYAQQVGNDIFDAFARGVEDKAGVTVNQALVNAIQAQIH